MIYRAWDPDESNERAVKCVHACKCRRSPDRYIDAVPGHVLLCCLRCLGYLPMGASRDVAVEVRAAEIADEWTVDRGTVDTSTDEDIGWLFHFNEDVYGSGYQGYPESGEQHAGWLAHAIATHDAEQMAEARARVAAQTAEDRARMGIPEPR